MMTTTELRDLYQEHGSLKAVVRETGTKWCAVQKLYRRAVTEGVMPVLPCGRKRAAELKDPLPEVSTTPTVTGVKHTSLPIPPKGRVYRYLFTSAQNATPVHKSFWRNLEVFAETVGAQIHVSRFTYMHNGLGASGDKALILNKRVKGPANELWWAAEVSPYLSDERLRVAPGLMWCGEMNILPTAIRPLSGLDNYTGRRSGIFPHAKIAMESIPTTRDTATKFNYTTGACTLKHYIQRKTGLKGEFHHAYGALLVEVDHEGHWWCRQINATDDGSFQDLTVAVKDGKIIHNQRAEAINWGDVHVEDLDPVVKRLAWGKGEMRDTLNPKYEILHDVLNFGSRSYHDLKNPHLMFAKYQEGRDNVRGELTGVREFLRTTKGQSQRVIVSSNHHEHLGKWLQTQDGRLDPVNARFWACLQAHVYEYIDGQGLDGLDYFRLGLEAVAYNTAQDIFLGSGESFLLCGDDPDEGIECGIHGHDGPGGRRGSPQQFARMGRRMNTGHTHAAGIIDGAYTAGACSKLYPEYVRGPGNWSHTHIVTYPNGKRTLVTMFAGKWRA